VTGGVRRQVSFYRNLEPLGAARLPGPLTDCDNRDEGLLLGGAALELGGLRFYPSVRPLAPPPS